MQTTRLRRLGTPEWRYRGLRYQSKRYRQRTEPGQMLVTLAANCLGAVQPAVQTTLWAAHGLAAAFARLFLRDRHF